jgi:pyruvate dehydrogenase E2 component (dihydrolipoamide acetyltransferase)
MSDFLMPMLGADMEKGTLVKWFITPGAHVNRGDVVADVETDKGVIAVEIWQSGDIEQILVEPGQEVAVGTVLAKMRSVADKERPSVLEPKIIAEPKPSEGEIPQRAHASPLAKRIAEDLGVDLIKIKGTGPNGAITRADVEGAAKRLKEIPQPTVIAEAVAAPVTTGVASSDQMRRAVAAAMVRSKRDIPHYYLQTDVNVQKLTSWLTEENRRIPVTERILAIAPIMKAIALGLRESPEFNGFYKDGAFQPQSDINLGMIISLRGGGLVAPGITAVDVASVPEIMSRLRDLIERGRRGKLRSSEITSPTVTISSLGEQGVDVVYGVIYPPQVALVGLGGIRERPWADSGMVGAAHQLTITVSADHRVSDGHLGSRLLNRISELLQNPEAL